MKALLCSIPPNTNRAMEEFSQKLGVTRVIRWMEKNDYTPDSYDFFDIDALTPDDNEIKKYFEEYQPDVIGLSAVVSTSYIQVRRITKIAREVCPSVWIICGGGLANSANVLLRKTEVDICVLGDGEVPFLALLEYAQKNNYGENNYKDLEEINGIAFIPEDGELHFNGFAEPLTQEFDPIADLRITKLGIKTKPELIHKFFPAKYGGVDIKDTMWFALDPRSREPDRLTNLATIAVSKGCVAKCSFCQRITKSQRVMEFEISDFEKYLIQIKEEFNVGYVFIVDENFGLIREHSYEVARTIKKQDLLWSTTAIRCTNVTLDDLKFYQENNCVGIKYGFESGSQTILNMMQKNFSVEDIWKATSGSIGLGYLTPIAIMVGIPGETEETAAQTGRFIARVALLMGVHPEKLGVAIF
jgi:radical SAM superfamily enzyme YgiQ (UPF0313 family)